MVVARLWKAAPSGEVSGEASQAFSGTGTTVTRGSLITRLVYSARSSTVSPGNKRKLAIASALAGSRLSLIPPATMVTAVVVRIEAFVVGLASSLGLRNRPNSQGLAKAACSVGD